MNVNARKIFSPFRIVAKGPGSYSFVGPLRTTTLVNRDYIGVCWVKGVREREGKGNRSGLQG
jgi:hypothetical protein